MTTTRSVGPYPINDHSFFKSPTQRNDRTKIYRYYTVRSKNTIRED